MKLRIILICAMTLAFATGCSGFGKKVRSFLGGEDPEVSLAQNQKKSKQKFSDNPNLGLKSGERNYRRYTVAEFEKEQGLTEDRSGSLWVMEGQGSYLFSDNLQRNVGDLINVELDGNPRSQLSTKVGVLKKLMEKGKKKREIASVNAAPGGPAPAANPTPAPNNPAAQPGAAGTAAVPNPNAPPGAQVVKEDDEKEEELNADFTVDLVPSRIVERLSDGSYRVRGVQAFMIGKKEHRVIMTGIVRPGDISNDRISASKVLEPRFDIVGLKKELR